MARLVRIAGRAAPDEVPLAGPVSIGRGDDNDVRLFDETASRRHATVRTDDGHAWLEDLGSSNGTRVNGAPVSRVRLAHGDEIAVGDVRFRYLAEAGGDRPTRIVVGPDPDEDATVEAAVDPAAADPSRGPDAVARMRLLCRAAETAAGTDDPDRLVRDLLDLLVEGLRPDRACVLIGRPGAMRVAADHPKGAGGAPASKTLLRRVAEEGEAVLVRDASAPEARGHASLVAGRWRATIAAPLDTVEGVAGLVTLDSEQPNRFDRDDLEVVAAVARQAALALRTLSALSSARAEVRRLARPEGASVDIVGASTSLRGLLEQVDRVAAADSTALVLGETGTGKELVARRIHAQSGRRSGPFVALNCAALVEGLLESELFGHEKGAFTGADARREGRIAQAAAGTLFLDEVGELSPALQAKLLRVLSDRTYSRVGGRDVLPVRCRVVAATHRDLPALVREGKFREDLYYRLAVVVLTCPPLRERRDDVEALAEALLERIAARLSRRVPQLDRSARDALRAHAWPGNVRELENALERALVLSDAPVLSARDLLGEPRDAPSTPAPASEATTMREAERRAVAAALRKTGGKKGEAASLLGISWPTLTRKMREFGL